MPRIGFIVGSIAEGSINRKVAQAVATMLPEGYEAEFLDLSELPIYNYELDGDFPAVGRAWKDSIEAVDGVIIVTPEYSRSIPGVLKNALDWAARPWGQNSFTGKPVAVMGASISAAGTAMAQQHLRNILAHFNAPTMGQPETFFHYNPDAFAADGSLQDEAAAAVLRGFAEAAAAHVSKFATETVSA
ncbi:NADPH-dependent FMN reductase [Demequina zhanjiangensis]|uniref:NAD(P)H-dependent oxidoreductase n=1 Tax=Demequina zhanjiangensis TaxID=3051659 RepID=A0ABT8FYH5_9MICO|nr:NAD(P)H-dependent oxidoreductase [Demequina sp. SYSU T00b26]MDN4471887.1 NAD(P)H-dependent oxidoreductase [Demequina sp. SYSU T00b26]